MEQGGKLSELLQEMKEASEKKVWFRGMELSRQDSIFAKSQSGSRRYFIVHEPSKRGKYEVYLDPVDFDWGCSCAEPDSPCSHAVAAVLALHAEKEGKLIPGLGHDSWSICYQLVEDGRVLLLRRQLQKGQQIIPFFGSVLEQKDQQDPSKPLDVIVSNFDLEFDAYLKKKTHQMGGGGIDVALQTGDLSYLKNLSLSYHGKPVFVGEKHRGYRLLIAKQNSGVVLTIESELGIFYGDLFLSANQELHPAVELPFSSSETQSLLKGRYLGLRETIEFYSKSFAKIRSTMEVANQGYEAEKMPSSIVIDSWEDRGRLCLRYHLAYGEPVCAFVSTSGLEVISNEKDMIIPIRSKEIEEKALYDFERKTGLTLMKVYEFPPPEAFELAKKMLRSDFIHIGTSLEKFADVTEEVPTLSVQDGVFLIQTTKGLLGHSALKEAKSNDGVCQLSDGSWIKIPRHWLAGEGSAIVEILSITGAKASKAAMIALKACLEERESHKALASLTEDWNLSFPLKPSPIQLRPYQESGAKWLAKLQQLGLGGILADDMGLGKTYQTLASLETPALIVVPTSLMGNWQSEVLKARPELRSCLYHGKDRLIPSHFDIIITTYGILRTDFGILEPFVFQSIVLDEAQQIKNPHSKTARAVYGLNSKSRIALSGTPVENSLNDLWSIMNFCMPGLLGSFENFKSVHSTPESLLRLKKMVSPFLLRRMKNEVAKDLPEKVDQIIRCTMDSDQKDFYRSLLRKVQSEVKDKTDSMAILTGLLRLRQAACDPFLVDSSQDVSSAKLEYLFSAIDELVRSNQSALVFSQWTSLLDRVELGLRERSILWSRIDGATSDRDSAVKLFMEGEVPIMLISMKAGGTGLNLTKADHVFILDPWWNPAAEEQAISRAHRIGRTENVMIHRLVTEDTVEEKIMELKAEKMNLFSEIMSGREKEASLNLADYESILFD